MGFRDRFDATQWALLQRAPFLVLCGVSGRYRGFPAGELLVFERWLDEARRAPGNLSRELLGSIGDVPAYVSAMSDQPVTIAGGLVTVGELLAGQSRQEVACLRDALVTVLGGGIARARGPYGQQPTPESDLMLTLMAEFLNPTTTFPAAESA